jgi:hypothetical protein
MTFLTLKCSGGLARRPSIISYVQRDIPRHQRFDASCRLNNTIMQAYFATLARKSCRMDLTDSVHGQRSGNFAVAMWSSIKYKPSGQLI